MAAKRSLTSLVGLILVFIAFPAFAVTWYVPGDYPTISGAIGAASDSDEIEVGPGVYDENLVIGKNIRIYSTGGPAVTHLRGDPVDPLPVRATGIYAWNAPFETNLQGFSVSNDKGPAALPNGDTVEVGIYIDPFSVPGLRDLWITDNHDHGVLVNCAGGVWTNLWIHDNGHPGTLGGGIRQLGGTPNAPFEIVDSLIEENMASRGGGIYTSDNLTGMFCTPFYSSSGTEWRFNQAMDPTSGGDGGAIYVTSGVPNDMGPQHTNDRIHDNQAGASGGAFYLDGLGLMLTDCTLADNQALAGGGGGGRVMTVSSPLAFLWAMGTDFVDNRAANGGGGIYNDGGNVVLNQSTLLRNDAGIGAGGGIYSTATLGPGSGPPGVNLNDSLVESNQADGNGGGLSATNTGLTLNTTQVTGNLTSGSGGGIYAGGQSSLDWFEGVGAWNNSTGGGGGIYADNLGRVQVANVSLVSNTTLGFGGGLAVDSVPTLDVSGSELRLNSADQLGGGMYATGVGVVTFTDSIVDLNQLTGGVPTGAGLYLDQNPEYNITGNTISNHSADLAAGLWLVDGYGLIQQNRFLGNQAAMDGGGMILDTTSVDVVEVAGNFFGGNSAVGHGGGLYITSGDGYSVHNNILIENTAGSMGGNVFVNGVTDLVNNDLLCGSAGQGAGAWIGQAATDIRNNIVAWNDPGNGVEAPSVAIPPTAEYNDAWLNLAADWVNVALGSGNISDDPVFAGVSCDGDFSNDDYRLDLTSPCVNTGDPAPTYDDPDGTRNDMGAIGGNDSCLVDGDGDGEDACSDCDDSDPVANNLDVDGDGVTTCDVVPDCDDFDVDNFPGNPEFCDGKDNDCNLLADFPGETTDGDGDGSVACIDCDDNDGNNFPGNPEVCDGFDNDCDGALPPEEEDTDSDTFINCIDCNMVVGTICQDVSICPEICDGEDNDCNGVEDDCTDSDLCTTGDACVGGNCEGTPVDCDDGNPCTDDSCDPSDGSCINDPAPNEGNSCDDGDLCTSGDVCASGVCAGTAVDCDDSNSCTADSCIAASGCINDPAPNNGNSCNDGDACTSGDVCASGVCAGTAVDCDDNNACTTDSCDVDSGCVNDPAPHEGDACDDADLCTSGEVCTSGTCTGTAVDCDDSNACTTDSCDATSGCVNNPVPNEGDACDDADACTSGDACASGVCTGTVVDCDDSNACTADSCDSADGSCVNDAAALDGTACDDNDACTENDACQTGACTGSGVDCDDGLFCSGTETCDPAFGCESGTPEDCDDGVACTFDECVTGADACSNTPDHTTCEQGQICDPVQGCIQHTCTTDEDCDDGNLCNGEEACADSACIAGTDLSCDDGLYCNGEEYCIPDSGCVSGLHPNCDDGVDCTVDSCNETDDGCEHDPDHSACGASEICDPDLGCIEFTCSGDADCDDGNPCNGEETCNVDTCEAGIPVECGDDNWCTVDSCDPATGECVFDTDPMDGEGCDDGDDCTEDEECNAGECQGGTDTCESSPASGCDCHTSGRSRSLGLIAFLALLGLAIQRRRS